MTASRRVRALLAAALLACYPGCGGAPERPDVVLITADTLRADRLGVYGYPLETTPFIDALAARGVVFADCTAQWPKTWPSMASLMTGTYPKTNGMRVDPRRMPDSTLLIAKLFQASGYRTGAVVANLLAGRALGFDGGFELFRDSWADEIRKAPDVPGRSKRFKNATRVNDTALEWVAGLSGDAPLFLWLHYVDPHGPYFPPERYAGLFRDVHPRELMPRAKIPRYQKQLVPGTQRVNRDLGFYKAQYDREVRYLDDEIRRLVERLDALRAGRPRLLVLTADHGESLGEHDYYLEHGKYAYQPSARVPAIVVFEGVLPAGRRVDAPVGLIDLSATLVELAGLERPASFEGRSLVALMQGRSGEAPAHVFSEAGYDAERTQRSVREGRWKLIHVRSPNDRAGMTGAEVELYDLEADPGELRNLAAEHPEVVARLRRALDAWAGEGDSDATAPVVDLRALDPASQEMLRTLGYLEAEAPSPD